MNQRIRVKLFFTILIILILILRSHPNIHVQNREIAVVSPYDLSVPGGVQCQVYELACEYKKYFNRVFVFAPGQKPDDFDSDIVFSSIGKTTFVKNNGSVAPVCLDVIGAYKLRKRLLRFHYIHIHEPYAPIVSWPFLLGNRDSNQKIVLTFHRSSDTSSRAESMGYKLARRMTKGCKLVGVSAQAIRTSLCDNLIEIPNGIRVLQMEECKKYPRIVFVGRHEHRKGLEVLLKAYIDSSELRGKYGLVIIGEGKLTESLKRKYHHSKIEWLGRVSNEVRNRCVAESAVYCAPTLGGESFGIVLLEAMVLRTPVVASDINGYREASGGCASLVPPGDVIRLRNALLNLDVDVEKAYTYACSFDISRIAEQYTFCMNIF